MFLSPDFVTHSSRLLLHAYPSGMPNKSWPKILPESSFHDELAFFADIVGSYLMDKFHLLVRMMAVGNMARILHDPKNRELLLGVIPAVERRDVIRKYFEYFDTIRLLIKSTQLKSNQWIGAKERLLVPFAKWMQRADTLGYVGLAMVFSYHCGTYRGIFNPFWWSIGCIQC